MHPSIPLLALALLALAACGGRSGPAARPNVVVLLADDLAPGCTGFEGHELVRTPALDRLAAGGLFLSRAYVPLPQCAPSRASLHTGRRPHEAGVPTNDGARLDPAFRTIAELARDAGYRTAFLGKWHLGRERRPQAGFEHWRPFVHPRYEDPHFWAEGRPEPREGHAPEVLVDLALEFLDGTGAAGDPFLLWISFKSPHAPPVFPPDPALRVDPAEVTLPATRDEDLSGKPSPQRAGAPREEYLALDEATLRRETAAYYSLIAALDRAIGRLDGELARRGLAEDTLVLFLSDNGWLLGEHGMVRKGALLYEELVRVPWVARWPGRVPAGARSDALVSTLDLYPTLAEVFGTEAPPPREPWDGRSILPLLTGGGPPERDALYLEYWKKRPEDAPTPLAGVVTAGAKYTRYLTTGEEELYDLARDPRETDNRAGVAGPVLDELRGRADRFVGSLPAYFR